MTLVEAMLFCCRAQEKLEFEHRNINRKSYAFRKLQPIVTSSDCAKLKEF